MELDSANHRNTLQPVGMGDDNDILNKNNEYKTLMNVPVCIEQEKGELEEGVGLDFHEKEKFWRLKYEQTGPKFVHARASNGK